MSWQTSNARSLSVLNQGALTDAKSSTPSIYSTLCGNRGARHCGRWTFGSITTCARVKRWTSRLRERVQVVPIRSIKVSESGLLGGFFPSRG